MKRRIEIYDTTLRDGTQSKNISVSVEDKVQLARLLDGFGVDFIEGGWPSSNPKDAAFFERAATMEWQHARIAAFGSTARHPDKIKADDNLHALIKSDAPVLCIFGKTWRLHAADSLGFDDEENARLIERSVAYLVDADKEVFFDAEHFFDGYKDDPEFAIAMVRAAARGGASRIVLCDTNGGSLPDEVRRAVAHVVREIDVPVGIHAHDDGGLAVANSLAAVEAGAVHVQGTINGLGERCGNANLCTVLPNLVLKCDCDAGAAGSRLSQLTHVAHTFYELTNQAPNPRAPYVGTAAFTHKGGIHVSSVLKDPRMYEHIDPALVGNHRDVVISELSGKSNVRYLADKLGMDLGDDPAFSHKFVARIKELENEGFQFDGAEASLRLMLLGELGQYQPFFTITYAKVHDMFDKDGLQYSEAVVKATVDGQTEHTAADGNGPVNALDQAMRKALLRFYPRIAEVHLLDYKVRVLDGSDGTQAKVRVLIESGDKETTWSTVGVSHDIIAASLTALSDSLNYKLYKDRQA